MPQGTQRLRYITNHDISAWEGSLTDLYETSEGSLSAFVITTFLNGIPLLYTGQEIAWPYTISFFNINPLDWSMNREINAEYKNILSKRNELPSAMKGVLETFPDEDIAIFKRKLENEEILVMANVRNEAVSLTLPASVANTLWTNVLTDKSVSLAENYDFRAFEYLILENKL